MLSARDWRDSGSCLVVVGRSSKRARRRQRLRTIIKRHAGPSLGAERVHGPGRPGPSGQRADLCCTFNPTIPPPCRQIAPERASSLHLGLYADTSSMPALLSAKPVDPPSFGRSTAPASLASSRNPSVDRLTNAASGVQASPAANGLNAGALATAHPHADDPPRIPGDQRTPDMPQGAHPVMQQDFASSDSVRTLFSLIAPGCR